MDSAEYDNIARLEGNHWYYRGKRILVRTWANRFLPKSPNHPRLLDCGAGTGLFAEEAKSEFEVYVADDHEESLHLLQNKFPPEKIIQIGPNGVEAPPDHFDVITALDVLEHIKEDQSAVKGIHNLLVPNGLFVATVPASMILWSDWDESLHHYRRYSRKSLQDLFQDEWDVLHINYTNTVAFPAVWFLRKIRKLFPELARTGNRSEDHIPSRLLNNFLQEVFVRTGLSRIPFPFGVSLIVVARKRKVS